jgi:excisionase family DNA binding protein
VNGVTAPATRTMPRSSLAALGERLLDVAEVAGWANVGARLVRAAVSRGDLRAIRLGRLLRFRPSDVAAWVRSQSIGGPA